MQTGRRILNNLVALTLSIGIQRLSNFVLVLYIARALGAGALGQYTIVMSLILIFQTLSLLGQQQIAIREVARAPDEAGAYLVNGSLIVAVGGLLSMLAMFVVARGLGYEPETLTYVYVAALSLIPGSLALVAEAVLQGQQQMRYITLGQAISGSVKLVLALLLLHRGVGLWSAFLVLALSNALLYLIYVLIIRRLQGAIPLHLDRALIRRLLSLAGTFVVISIFGVVFKQVDVLLLGKMKDAVTVGIYSAAFRLIQIGMQFRPAFALAFFPHMSEVYIRSPERLGLISERALKLSMIFILPLTVALSVFAKEVVLLFYGSGYSQSARVLHLLAWTLLLYFANAVLYRNLLASDNERITLRVAGVNMVVSVLLDLLLIPRWGALGVAVAVFLTTLGAVMQNYYHLSRQLFKINWLRLVSRPAMAGLLLAGALLALRPWSLALSLAVGMAVYVTAIFAFKVFSPEELNFVRRTWADALERIT